MRFDFGPWYFRAVPAYSRQQLDLWQLEVKDNTLMPNDNRNGGAALSYRSASVRLKVTVDNLIDGFSRGGVVTRIRD